MAEREVETASEVPPDATLPDLTAVPGVARAERVEPVRLVATYWDTAGLDLARVGVSLRRRTGGHDEGWHLKVPAGTGGEGRQRTEHRVGGDATAPPTELLALARSRLRGVEPVPVLEVVTERTTTALLDDGGAVLAEVADDRVDAHAPDGTAGSRWREWEVELVDGDDALLAAVGPLLAEAGATPRTASKLQRALGDALPAPASPEPADGSAGEVVRARVARDVERLLAAETGVRLGDDDAVHDARVAARRLRATLGVFRPVVDRAVTDPVRDDLRDLGRVLGAARDPYVEQAALDARLADEPVELVLGPVARRIAEDRSAARTQALARAVEVLDSAEHLRLLTTLDAWATTLPRGPRAGDDAADVLPRRVGRAWRRVERRALEADAATGDARDSALHALRRAARRARYAATTASPAVGRPARRSADRAHAVQDVLGRQQDPVVRRETLRRLGVQAHLDGDSAFTFGRLHALEQASAAASDDEAARAVRRVLAASHRAWMG